MKQAMVDYMQRPIHDELYTPREAIEPLLPYLPTHLTYWECTDHGNSLITTTLKENNISVINTHINNGFNFLTDEPSVHYDAIITNPPYSLKTEFLRRAYELNKPFAFLLPLTALEGIERSKMFREYGIEVLVLDKRINFMKNKKNVWFNTSWFCRGLLDKELIFIEVGDSKCMISI